ncbi:MAG TPA: glutamate--tRNA ligase [Bacteroidales bacterium]|nr:glutamate--tRNA ligase [Bacteroidales bacterium]HPR56902.1 glutamate--tRNA ligase [Bacteroidales bacterium]
MTEQKPVRVRFAPSPTGPLHIGGVRTALYNYLFAKRNKGTFLLRIEDTDQLRYVPGAEEYIIRSLKWCGIEYDEGPDTGGKFAPYRQSERKALYAQYADLLVSSGNAYYAFDTPEELETMRERLKAEKSDSQQYDVKTRNTMNNSLTMSEKETRRRIEGGEPYVIRIKIPEGETIVVNDLIRGSVEVKSELLDDKVLFKSDGMPTYHLANIVDDHLMEISHVIRGEEWLPSAPLHVFLYKCFGWEAPKFAHLPLLLKPDGNGKLSKRDGDRLGFPVFPLQWTDPVSGEISSGYRESGYFPEAFINMLALLGWNPGTEQEIFSLEQLAEEFTLERVGKSGSKFDPEKAKWFNHKYLTEKSDAELAVHFMPVLAQKGLTPDPAFVQKVVGIIKERATFITDFWEQSSFFFIAPQEYDEQVVKKRWKADTGQLMNSLKERLVQLESFTAENFKESVHHFVEEKGIGMGVVMNALRLVLVGGAFGPDLALIAGMIGKSEVINRIETGISKLG